MMPLSLQIGSLGSRLIARIGLYPSKYGKCKFTDFIERAATAIIRLTVISLSASYKMCSVSLWTKYGNFVNWAKQKHISSS